MQEQEHEQRGDRGERVHGEQNIGHTPQALDEMSISDHNRLHNVEEPAMWRSVKQAGSQADNIFGAFRNATFRAMTPIMEYGAAIDELTGGHVHRGAQQIINMFRQAVGQLPNPIRDY